MLGVPTWECNKVASFSLQASWGEASTWFGVRAGSEKNGIVPTIDTSRAGDHASEDTWDRMNESGVLCPFHRRHLEVEGEPCREAGDVMDPKGRAGGPSVNAGKRCIYKHQGDCR